MSREDGLALSMESRTISWRKWVLAFICFLLLNAVLLSIARGTPRLAQFEILILYLLYMSVAFTFLPLPTAWIVLWAAREVDPFSVALIGTVGTCIANLHDYYIIHYLFKVNRIKETKRTRFYRGAVGWFQKAPFATLTAASFLPIPIDVVRILAVSTGYPRRWYVLATFAGRFPRYLMLAYVGYELKLSNQAIFIVFLATALIGLAKGLLKLKDRYDNRDERNDEAM
jgi:membrane protein YqaA with SNARE-associated domain